MSEDLPIMAGQDLYERMSPSQREYYKPCGEPHGMSCQVFIKKHKSEKLDFVTDRYPVVIDDVIPHYWLNYDPRTHRPTPYNPPNFKEILL